MKLRIYLDFDGVLCTQKTYMESQRTPLAESGYFSKLGDPACVAALNRIISVTGAEIVLSTTWRIGGINSCTQYLRAWGVIGEIAGVTPIMDTDRGREIQAHLDSDPCDNFVILDDDEDMVHLIPKLVQSTFVLGLTEELADRAIAMLMRG